MPELETQIPVVEPQAPQADPASPATNVVETAPPQAPPSPPPAEPTGPATAQQPAPPPAEAVAPVVPPTPPAPVITPEVQQYIESLERQNDQRVIEEFTANLATQLENEQGLTPEQAKWVANREGQQAYRAYHAERLRQGQVNAAFEIGGAFRVDPRQLMHLPTPEAMVQAATAATAQTQFETRLKALETENAALKKRLAPPQQFATGAASTQPSSSYIEKLKSGGPLPTTAEIDAYTKRYLTGSP